MENNNGRSMKKMLMEESNRSTTRMLVDAEAILDYDLAIMKIFQVKYNNPYFVDQNVMLYNINQLRYALLKRQQSNPITICLIPDKITGENADELCREIYNNDRQDILDVLTFTDTFRFVSLISGRDFYDIAIWCADEERQNVIKNYDKNLNTILCSKSEIVVDNYDAFIVKNFLDVTDFPTKLQKKHIFVQDYGFNIDKDPKTGEEFPKVELTLAMMGEGNDVSTIGVYNPKNIEVIK